MILYETIKKVIDEWDPIDLFYFGCPSDEYDHESEIIHYSCASAKDLTASKLAKIIYDVFTASFGSDVFLDTQEDCQEVAKKMLEQ